MISIDVVGLSGPLMALLDKIIEESNVDLDSR